jgi:hypothetical protein
MLSVIFQSEMKISHAWSIHKKNIKKNKETLCNDGVVGAYFLIGSQ